MLNTERCDVMYGYYLTEKSFRVNNRIYQVECILDRDAMFYCLCHDDLVCQVHIPSQQWEQLNNGLSLAYAYNCVLDKMEHCVVQYGR